MKKILISLIMVFCLVFPLNIIGMEIQQPAMTTQYLGKIAAGVTTNPLTLTPLQSMNMVVYYEATGQINLPTAVSSPGGNVMIYNTSTNTTTIAPNGTEIIYMKGTSKGAGNSFTLSGGAGSFVVLISDGTSWATVGYNGTLT